MLTEIAFTGTPVTDLERARAFYEGVLGFRPSRESAGGRWVEYDLGNGTFGIGCYGEAWQPSPSGTCVAFEADDFEAEIARLKSQGVKFAADVTPGPVCQFAIICDPDDNKILIHKRRAT